MGGRITVDSATLINKGFEMIEAFHLFGVPYERIDVVVHPQSIVHSLVHLNDGASLAHLGYPDMRVPISYALHFPERADVPVERLDLAAAGELSFEAAGHRRPSPACAWRREAGEAGGTAPCVLNAADEVAVAAFLAGEIPFTAIPEVIEAALDRCRRAAAVTHFDDLYAADAERPPARPRARLHAPERRQMTWILAFAGFAVADHPARVRALRRSQGDRDAGRALLPLLPAGAGLEARGARPSTGSARSRWAAS